MNTTSDKTLKPGTYHCEMTLADLFESARLPKPEGGYEMRTPVLVQADGRQGQFVYVTADGTLTCPSCVRELVVPDWLAGKWDSSLQPVTYFVAWADEIDLSAIDCPDCSRSHAGDHGDMTLVYAPPPSVYRGVSEDAPGGV